MRRAWGVLVPLFAYALLAPVAEAGPLVEQGCNPNLPFPQTRCAIATDTENGLNCAIGAASTLPGDLQKAIDDAIDAASRDVRNLKCAITKAAYETYNESVHPWVVFVECTWGAPLCPPGYSAPLGVQIYPVVRSYECWALETALRTVGLQFTCPAPA